jgi:DNA-binding transcriptional MerR regulator
MTEKAAGAFRTIGELAAELDVPQHILRYWETRFSQLRPLTRAGNRRYYRPEDVALAKRIHSLLNSEGYTVKGVQKLLANKVPAAATSESSPHVVVERVQGSGVHPAIVADLTAIRNRLAAALAAA